MIICMIHMASRKTPRLVAQHSKAKLGLLPNLKTSSDLICE